MASPIKVNVVAKDAKPKKPVVKKRLVTVTKDDGVSVHRVRIAETDLPHKGNVTLHDPKIKERGPVQELVVYATAKDDTYEPGQEYVCYFSLKGKLTGFFTID